MIKAAWRMKYEKCIGMPVKRGWQKMWCVLDYVHSRTVKGKNFNGIKSWRKKQFSALRGKYSTRMYISNKQGSKGLDDLSKIQLSQKYHSLISKQTSFTLLIYFFCHWLLAIYANSNKLWWLKCMWLMTEQLPAGWSRCKMNELETILIELRYYSTFLAEVRHLCFISTAALMCQKEF